MSKISLPFHIKEVFNGMAETGGLFCLNDDKFSVEFQTKDSLVGLIKSKINTILISLGDIAEVHFKNGFFRKTLTIRFSNLKVADQLPNQSSGELKVSIERRNADIALEFVSVLELKASEFVLKYPDK
ncbi:MAG: hypothetical protein COA79_12595 [Planctomycetota bacterium]|nr:MAG: hypothetical protein COA79_12595 [Planctomycetota bacterium]